MMDIQIATPKQLADHFKSLRLDKGLSQSKLGEILGVSQARVAQIESDPSLISVAQFFKILSTLDTSVVLRKRPDPSAAPIEVENPSNNAPRRNAW